MVILSGEDVKDNTFEKRGNDFFSACSIVTKKWYNDRAIIKKRGARRYTTKCQVGLGKKVYGHMSVTNHYTVTDTGIKFREAMCWDYGSSGPFKISEKGDAKLVSSSKCTKRGQTLSVMTKFEVVCKKEGNVSLSGQVGGVSVGTASTWKGSITKICKLYANVELRSKTTGAVLVDQYGVCQHGK